MRVIRAICVVTAAGALFAVAARASTAGPNATLLVSRPRGLAPLPATVDNASIVWPKAVSGDGRTVVFVSQADDLGVSDTFSHVWIRTVFGTATLVDRVPGGGAPGNGVALGAAISRDGSTVCFLGSATNLVPGISGNHVFVVTLASGAIAVADRGAGGAVGNSDPRRCGLDAGGTRVVFDSSASNLVPGDTNLGYDVFVRDMLAASTTRVSVDAQSGQAPSGGRDGVISADGLKVAFISSDPLVGGDTNGASDVYVRNLGTNGLVRASVSTGSLQANGGSFAPAIDDAGTHVAFFSSATNLDLGADTNNANDVFWRDLTGSDTTIAVSRATGATGALGDADSDGPAISGDGFGVAFESAATNLGAGTSTGPHVYLRRLGANETLVLSRASGATGTFADAGAIRVSLATAPTVAVFGSRASNLAPDASGEFFQVFRRDLDGEPVTSLVSRPAGTSPRHSGVNGSFVGGARAISADGRFVVFQSDADGLDPAGASRFSQIFVRDVLTDAMTLVSRGPGSGGAANDHSSFPAVSADGRRVAFVSGATNLVAGATGLQIYVRDLATGDLEIASRVDGPGGALATDVDSADPDLDADGRRVAFATGDPLVPADTNGNEDVYVRDLVTGTTTLVSVTPSGAAGARYSNRPSISDDGRRVAFSSSAPDLLAGTPLLDNRSHVYVRDLQASTTVLADRRAMDGMPGTGDGFSPEISGAGHHVVFVAREPLTSDPIPTDGALYVRDLEADTTLLVSRGDGPSGPLVPNLGSGAISREGTKVSFASRGPGLPGAPDLAQVFVRDLAANTTVLASAADGTTATVGNDPARDAPALSAGGGCVVFGSTANNLTTPAYPTRDFDQVYLHVVAGECPETGGGPTTTLPGDCGTSATYASVDCRLAALRAAVTANGGKLARKLGLKLDAARRAVGRAARVLGRRKGKASKAALRQALKALKRYETVLGSKKARRLLDDAVRTGLTAPVARLEADVPALPTSP